MTEDLRAVHQRASAEWASGPELLGCAILPAVLCLLFLGGPSAVLRVVPTVVVNSVEPLSVGSRLHVLNEIGKTIAPAIADGNAASALICNPPQSVGQATGRARR